MSTQPVTLDFSKSQPIQQGGITLDFSKAQSMRPDFSQNAPPAAGPHVNMEESHPFLSGPGEIGTDAAPASGSKIPQSIQHAPDSLGEAIAGVTAAGVLGTGAGVAAPVARPIARAGVNFARNHPFVTTMALEGAKEIPGIGRYVSRIPSWLPMLAGGKARAALPEVEAATEAEAVAPIARSARPLSTPKPPLDETYNLGPRPVIQRGPLPGSAADTLESKGIAESVRNAAEGEGRIIASQGKKEWFAQNQPGSSKSELTGAPEKPVRFTKTPGLRGVGAKPGTTVPEPDQDLTPLLKQSLSAARKKKSQ